MIERGQLLIMNVAVIFGGMSCEHDISIITGMQVLHTLLAKHNTIPIYIDQEGVWWTGKRYYDIDNYQDKSSLGGRKVYLKPGDTNLYYKRSKVQCNVDIAVLCCHGVNGEDGTLQGLLQLSHIPYSGSGVLASAIGMDKSRTKAIFNNSGLAILPYVTVDRQLIELGQSQVLQHIQDQLQYPLIVKPCNLGSSIGISVAHDSTQLLKSIAVALEWDNSVIVEHALVDFDELNCAVLGGKGYDILCSELEQPKVSKDYLTYDDKYQSRSKCNSRNIPAKVSQEIKQQVHSMSRVAFESLGCSGVARCDFLLKDGVVYINEINTIPGSLSNYLFEYSGIKFGTLLEKLIYVAQAEFDSRYSIKYAYDSQVLHNIAKVSKS
ncbi:MAG: D-alanine--D-alanine ligase [Clostridiales bacterium]|jgi:D-alanine-D-alanine ligase|nr:D-alanine--D-alanine ligase [Clostridiales bacterium]